MSIEQFYNDIKSKGVYSGSVNTVFLSISQRWIESSSITKTGLSNVQVIDKLARLLDSGH